MMTARFSSPLALWTVVISTVVDLCSTLSERFRHCSSHQLRNSAMSAIFAAEKAMTENKITSLLVTDEADRLVGVIQIYDIKL